MAVDTNLIYRAVRNVLIAANTNSSIPLSEIRTGKPSIGRYRGKTPKFDFPYAMIDIGPSRHSVGYLTNRFINDEGLVQYEVNKDYLVSVKVYSDRGESYQIANDFEFAMSFESNINQIQTTCEGTVHSTETVTPLPDILEDDSMVEYNQFNVTISVRDTYVDANSFTIAEVDLVGQIQTTQGVLTIPDSALGELTDTTDIYNSGELIETEFHIIYQELL